MITLRLHGKTRWLAALAAVLAAASLLLAQHATAGRPVSRSLGVSRSFDARAKAALLRYLSNEKPLDIHTMPGGLRPGEPNLRAPSSQAAFTSYNWGGYASYGSTPQAYTAVSASWTVPTLSCTKEQELSVAWVGIDGFNNGTVEQDGTLDYCFEGAPYYYTWWEMYPTNNIQVVGDTVAPGDSITASVHVSGTSYTLALTDATTPANSFSTTQTCALTTCVDESAEWIVERPSFSIGIAPLAHTSNAVFTSGSDTASGTSYTIAASPNDSSITMIDATDTYALQSVGALNKKGTGFTMHWLNSY